MSFLQVAWFVLIGVLLTGYAILDGFDLGVGIGYLFAKKERERRVFLNAIGPVWDGNEVWLIAAGGVLFAAFPMVYATVFSGFYLALMLVLFGLIFRAVALEFRGKMESEKWRRRWDAAFSVGSIIPALLFGVAVGNIMRGVPLDPSGNFAGSFFGLLNPYALIVGFLGFSFFATQGALFLVLKTEGDLAESVRSRASRAWLFYAGLFGIASLATFIFESHLLSNYLSAPLLFLIPAATIFTMAMTGYDIKKGSSKRAFIFNSLSVAGLVGMAGAAVFPNLVPALGNPEGGLTAANASSSPLTLTVMLIIALIGMPLVIGYTIFVYRTFGGKVDLEKGIY